MVLDSNILIGYLRGDQNIISKLQSWRESGLVLCISAVSSIEVLSLSSLTATDIDTIEKFLDDFLVLGIDARIIRTAGALRRAYNLSVPDAAIAATAVVHRMSLVTQDKKLRTVPGISITDI